MALEGSEGSASRPDRSLPPGKTRYPLYRRLGGSQGRSGKVRKISPPPRFDPRTVQPVACRYTDYATRPTFFFLGAFEKFQKATISFVIVICPSWRPTGTTRFPTEVFFTKFDVRVSFAKPVEQIQVLIKYGTNNECFTWISMHIFYHIALNSPYDKKCFRQKL